MTKNISVHLSPYESEFVKWLARRDEVSERTELEMLLALQIREEIEIHLEEFNTERSAIDKAIENEE